MANEQHIQWLLEGVEAWNARREKDDFRPDFVGLDFRERFNKTALIDRVGMLNFRHFNLSRADFKGALLSLVSLDDADLSDADLRSSFITATTVIGTIFSKTLVTTLPDKGNLAHDPESPLRTDLTAFQGLSQSQVNQMDGDSGTILPEHVTRPAHWPEIEGTTPEEPEETVSPVRFTPPAEFETRDWKLDVQHFPERPEPRQASATPVDQASAIRNRAAFKDLVATLCKSLRKYKREDAEQSNRVRAAEQLLVTAEALLKAVREPDDSFLPTLLEDYLETLALGFDEDVRAFESGDVGLYQRVIKRGRQLYAFYPELAEISDPTNTRFITDDFPYSFSQLSAELNEIVYSDDGLQHFSDSTRELIEAETNAKVPRDQDEEKTKIARLGAIVGELRHEMAKYVAKGQDAIDRAASWVKSYEKVEKIWETIKPFLGKTDGG